MKKRMTILAIAAAAVAAAPATASAAKLAPKAQASVLGPIKTMGSVATITVRYRCSGSEFLWVSAKQSPATRPDQRLRQEGSSQYAVGGAWLHSHRNPITCDGQFHTQTFTIDTVEWGWGPLRPGQAWVQFCVGSDAALEISLATWTAVRPA